jgi:hypothetical protein
MTRQLSEALRAQAASLLALAEALEHPQGDSVPDPWVGAVAYLDGAVPSRVVNAACACGQVYGATKRGKRWVARRSAIDQWISEAGHREPTTDAELLAAEWGKK